MRQVATALTDKDVNYILQPLVPGEYQIKVKANGYREEVKNIALTGNMHLDFTLSPGQDLLVKVLDNKQVPIEDAIVEARISTIYYEQENFTDHIWRMFIWRFTR